LTGVNTAVNLLPRPGRADRPLRVREMRPWSRDEGGTPVKQWKRWPVGLLVATLVATGCAAEDGGDGDGESEDGPAAASGDDGSSEDVGAGDYELDFDAVTLSMSGYVVEGHFQGQAEAALAEEIERRSEGLITVDVQYGQALAPLNEHARSLRDGIFDMGAIISPQEAEFFPITDWLSAMGSAPDRTPGLNQLQAHAGSVEWGFSDAAYEQYQRIGVFPLLPELQITHHYYLHCTEPVTSLDDARGKQVRNPGAAWAAQLRAIGMEPIDLPASEAFEAFQRGVIDCASGHPRNWVDTGDFQAAPEVMIDDEVAFPGFLSFGMYMNQQTWDGLPLEAQQIIWDSLPTFLEVQLTEAFATDRELYTAEEVTFHQYDQDLRDALKDFQAGVRDDLIASPPNGLSGDEAEGVIEDYEGALERWGSIIVDDLGYEFPDDAQDLDPDDLDLGPYIERYWEEILEPRRPA
jgi:TRAP-type C4-dicarboxylate transport system substrate-binding protein